MLDIRIIGLGKMGLNLAYNLLDHGYKVSGFDQNSGIKNEFEENGGQFYSSFEALMEDKEQSSVIWLMLPAGEITNNQVSSCVQAMNQGDILVDGGNSKFTDSQKNGEKAKEQGVYFFDVGTSGGTSGAREGACMMIGGDAEKFEEIRPLFEALCVKDGYFYCGPVGSGHYLKMIHNGIEYGMMQAIGEGFNLIHHGEYDYDLAGVAKVFNNGSVIRSWLMGLTEDLLQEDPDLKDIEGVIPSSGEGKWTAEEMLRQELSAPVITQALLARYASVDEEKYGEKVVASLRNQFGGHEVSKK
ncbi:phosphogluconate dehydrogenase (NAD(+)-dependent, decarboxylating) [Tetragenococcus osmophilus]|uniref:6-phosphogluconate dehydrogenase n=1 Tax=Tetragenococcus osmophilus TaxID=526944 RepID=A0AA38CWY5_9ENTE|nr:6-phosphogluconate dehydrogenase [Tetragenococcus osmophilus]GMA73299.1 6-phosphogluconate dehydrogenase [Tetragenococcus osmophilus]GMA73361.1 6-phosphogluconate dehydrogenase [Tetragenococcus osmophilus]